MRGSGSLTEHQLSIKKKSQFRLENAAAHLSLIKGRGNRERKICKKKMSCQQSSPHNDL